MRRTVSRWIGWLAVVVLAGWFAGEAVAKKVTPKTITLSNRQGPVTFDHHAHERYERCEACHHTMDRDKEKMACRDCHTGTAEGKRLSVSDAFHMTCRGCHTQKVKADRNAKAPVKCKDCHKK